MKVILGLTFLWIIAVALVLMRFTPGELSGWDVLVYLFYITITYIVALFGYGFLRSVAQFRDTLRDDPHLEQTGHRRGLVRQTQLPDWMRTGQSRPLSDSSVPQVPKSGK